MQDQQTNQAVADARRALGWVLVVMQMCSVTVEVFFRRRFGERYLSAPVMFGGFIVVSWASFIAFGGVSPLMNGFFLGYVLLCGVHQVSILRRRLQPIVDHSWDTGISWPIWSLLGIREGIVQTYLEPWTCLFVGYFFSDVDPAFGTFLQLVSIPFFAKNKRLARRRREMQLDLADNTMNSVNMSEVMNGSTGAVTQSGPATPHIGPDASSAIENVAAMRKRLDPTLLRLMNSRRDDPEPGPDSSSS